MSELPAAVTESTAIEVVRKEGASFSAKSVSTISAGDLVYFSTNSGLIQVVTAIVGTSVPGVALYDAASGTRCVTIRGHVRARWDGAGTVARGTPIGSSATRSGWFEPSAIGSGALIIGYSVNSLAAANSGTLVEVVI